ncbi:MAG: amidohydrolase family protein [Tetrasphaera sp.]
MIDGHDVVDAHVHVPVLGTLAPAWMDWARQFGPDGLLERVWDGEGRPRPQALDEHFAEQGVDTAILFCEYSPRATGMQTFDDLLPLVEFNPQRFRPMANVNPHLHFPVVKELRRQLDLGAAGLKLHPVHAGFSLAAAELYPAYALLEELGAPLVVHSGTSTFPGSRNELADPELMLPVVSDFPGLQIILAHGGRGWWYDAVAFLAQAHDNVWVELSGLPPRRLSHYYAKHDLRRLACRFVFATDWPGVPSVAGNAKAVAEVVPEDLRAAVLAGNARSLYLGLGGG